MTVLGEGKAPGKADIYKMGEKHGIKKTTIGLIVDEVADAANNFQTYAKTAGVSKTTLNGTGYEHFIPCGGHHVDGLLNHRYFRSGNEAGRL